MTEPTRSLAQRDFLSVARDTAMLSAQAADELAQEAAARNMSPAELALARGALNAIQVDIVQTLLHPTDAIPGYEILDVIGHGGMGVVYRARQQNLGRLVALKTMLVSQLANPSAAARFEQEAVTIARLQHPHIVAAHDFGRHAGRLFLAMELVAGDDAEGMIQRCGRLHKAQVWALIRQAASALMHAAGLGVVHRDIKPANLLLVQPPEGFPLPAGVPLVKVTDFGLALLKTEGEARTRLTMANAALGTPRYMAPEQLGDHDVDLRADIYALGATAYQMLTGCAPFAGKTVTQIVAEKLRGAAPTFEASEKVSAESARLVADMMAGDPDQRIPNYSELLRRIDALLRPDAAARTDATQIDPTVAAIDVAQATAQPLSQALTRSASPTISRRALTAGIAILLAGMALLLAWQWRTRLPPAGQRDLTPGDWSEYLFNGTNLQVWLRDSDGQWTIGKDDERANVLAGKDGVTRRRLVRSDGSQPRPLEQFKLQLAVAVHQASAIEIQFAIPAHPQSGSRLAIRFDGRQAVFGKRSAAGDRFHALFPALAVAGSRDEKHVLAIERHSRGWFVFFDDHPLGQIGALHRQHEPEFLLMSEGGPSWFSDILVEELVRANATP
jgi:serine/threonine protein kinase